MYPNHRLHIWKPKIEKVGNLSVEANMSGSCNTLQKKSNYHTSPLIVDLVQSTSHKDVK